MVLVLRLIGLDAPDVGHVALACVVSGVAWGQPAGPVLMHSHLIDSVTDLASQRTKAVIEGRGLPPVFLRRREEHGQDDPEHTGT